jgi:hypothetical protein
MTAPIAFNATAGEVQTALEAGCSFLQESLTVTGGGGTFTATFIGQLGNRPVALLTADGASLSGGGAAVTVKEVAEGVHTPQLVVSATNVGGASTDESTVTIEDVLPAAAEISATAIVGYDAYRSGIAFDGEGPAPLSCTAPPMLRCTLGGKVDPGDVLTVTIRLNVAPSVAPGLYTNTATVAGGGAPEASTTDSLAVGGAVGFGPAPGGVLAAISTSQAGAHPNFTTAFTLSTVETNELAGYPKDVHFDLPPGLVGSVVGMPRCPVARLIEQADNPNACPSDSMVGMAVFTLTEGAAREVNQTVVAPVYNLAPAKGEPAAFGFNAFVFPVRLDTTVLSNGNYGVRVTASGVPQSAQTLSTSVTIWGVPADHNGPGEDRSLYNLLGGGSFGGRNPEQTRTPLLSNPQQCTEPLVASMSADSWAAPGAFVSSGPIPLGAMTGCDHLSFEPAFTMLPDNLQAGAPAGYTFNLRVPERNEPDTLVTPDVKKVSLTLPPGVVLSPSATSGLGACSQTAFFGAGRGEQSPAARGNCPSDSTLGTVEVKSPDLALPLQGQVYLAEPECDPCTPEDARDGKMVRLFLQVMSEPESESPIVVKLEGRGTIDQHTGQITTTFDNNPQLPFSELKLSLEGGPRAPLANPRSCGAVTSILDAVPWSSPFTADALRSYGFEVNQGCFGPQFNPAFVAGLLNTQAGGSAPFTLSLGREDHDQPLGKLEVAMPPGVLGKLSSVTPCTEPQAQEGTCGKESLIGHTKVLTGPGSAPLRVTGGQTFLTGSYKGAPFGLSFVVPAVAGPYTLAGTTGKGTVVVRATVNVDPSDAHVTITTDPFPTTLDGIPLQLRLAETSIDRPEFMIAPTNCSKLAITGTVGSSEGMAAAVATPFQVANCATLPFKPRFSAATPSKTSKANGTSLHVRVTSSFGQANIASVKVDLPKQLPSRLTTLQKACPAAIFAANPASCPAGSLVGTAKAVSPILRSTLTGPAYLVSHAAAAFPDLEIVLQGEGITLILVGNTHIKNGITSTTFKSVPDAPVDTFDLVLPAGPHSALGANLPIKARNSMCAQKLSMPTRITGQNGAVISQATRIAIAGCPRHRVKHHHRRAGRHGSRSGGRHRGK